MPYILAEKINSVIGMTFILAIVIFLLLFSHPAVGLLSIIVAIILVHRTLKIDNKIDTIIRHNKSENEKDKEMKDFNPPQYMTFEEEFIEQNAPISTDIIPSIIMDGSFKPVNENIHGASSF